MHAHNVVLTCAAAHSEQMVAQIRRTDRWLDDCCRPVMFTLAAMPFGPRASFLMEVVPELEQSQPELVQAMLAQALLKINSDGTLSAPSNLGGKIYWEPPKEASSEVRVDSVCEPNTTTVAVFEIVTNGR